MKWLHLLCIHVKQLKIFSLHVKTKTSLINQLLMKGWFVRSDAFCIPAFKSIGRRTFWQNILLILLRSIKEQMVCELRRRRHASH